MGILKTIYNESERKDKTWYSSSNIIYSEFTEDANENKGNLLVVFKLGKTYTYDNVSYQDYLMFKHNSLEQSSGKSFNAYIVKKYQAEKQEDTDINALLAEMNVLPDKNHTYFIFGDDNIPQDVFETIYAPTLLYATDSNPKTAFIYIKGNEFGEKCATYLKENIGVESDRLIEKENSDSSIAFGLNNALYTICYVAPSVIDKIKDISLPAYILLSKNCPS